MQTNVTKWGNSLGIRLPLSIAKQVGISAGEAVDLIVQDHHILIQKIYRLETLLEKITPDNIHSEITVSAPVGKETW